MGRKRNINWQRKRERKRYKKGVKEREKSKRDEKEVREKEMIKREEKEG